MEQGRNNRAVIRAWLLFAGIGTLFTHELDAMLNHEWRVLPFTNFLPEHIAVNVFILAHIPLFALIIGLVASDVPRIRFWSRAVVAGFLVVHASLHILFSGHHAYEFEGLQSNALIFAGAGLGLAYLLLVFTAPRR